MIRSKDIVDETGIKVSLSHPGARVLLARGAQPERDLSGDLELQTT